MKSPAFESLTGFILKLGRSVKNKKNSDPCKVPSEAKGVLAMLDYFETLVDQTPIAKQKMRYGNTNFRVWFKKFADSVLDIQKKWLPADLIKAGILKEITPYLLDSFGNSARIDY